MSLWEIVQARELLEYELYASLTSLTLSYCSPRWFYQLALSLAVYKICCFSISSIALSIFLFDEYKLVISKFAFLWVKLIIFSFFKHRKRNYNLFGKEELSIKRMASTNMRPFTLKNIPGANHYWNEGFLILELMQYKVLD